MCYCYQKKRNFGILTVFRHHPSDLDFVPVIGLNMGQEEQAKDEGPRDEAKIM